MVLQNAGVESQTYNKNMTGQFRFLKSTHLVSFNISKDYEIIKNIKKFNIQCSMNERLNNRSWSFSYIEYATGCLTYSLSLDVLLKNL